MTKWDSDNLSAPHTQREIGEIVERTKARFPKTLAVLDKLEDAGMGNPISCDLISRAAALRVALDIALDHDTSRDPARKMQGATAATIHNLIYELPSIPSSQPTAEVEHSSLVQNCTFDLRGAGYDCVQRYGYTRIGVYGEGDKVLCEGHHVHLDGLHILGPTRIAEIEARAEKAEAEVERLRMGKDDDGMHIMAIQSRLSAMTENAKAMADLCLQTERYAFEEVSDGTEAFQQSDELAALRAKLMEGKSVSDDPQ